MYDCINKLMSGGIKYEYPVQARVLKHCIFVANACDCRLMGNKLLLSKLVSRDVSYLSLKISLTKGSLLLMDAIHLVAEKKGNSDSWPEEGALIKEESPLRMLGAGFYAWAAFNEALAQGWDESAALLNEAVGYQTGALELCGYSTRETMVALENFIPFGSR